LDALDEIADFYLEDLVTAPPVVYGFVIQRVEIILRMSDAMSIRQVVHDALKPGYPRFQQQIPAKLFKNAGSERRASLLQIDRGLRTAAECL
jgi:hypothetical protein